MPGLTYRTLDVVLGLKDGFEPKRIEWTWRGQDQSGRNAQIPGGGLNVGMAEENLDGPEIGAGDDRPVFQVGGVIENAGDLFDAQYGRELRPLPGPCHLLVKPRSAQRFHIQELQRNPVHLENAAELFQREYIDPGIAGLHKGVHFVGLNNCAQLEGLGQIGAEQLEWLGKDVARLTASTPIVVFAHIPLCPFTPSGAGVPRTARKLCRSSSASALSPC